jgi:hypothetical protein
VSFAYQKAFALGTDAKPHEASVGIMGKFFLRNYLKTVRIPLIVIPMETGIQAFSIELDPGFRQGDGMNEF